MARAAVVPVSDAAKQKNLNEISFLEALARVQEIMGDHLILPERAGLGGFMDDPPLWRHSVKRIKECADQNSRGTANWYMVPMAGQTLAESWVAVCKDCTGLQQNPDATWFLRVREKPWFERTGSRGWMLINFLPREQAEEKKESHIAIAVSLRAYAEACITIHRATGVFLGSGLWHMDHRTRAFDGKFLQVKMTADEGLELANVYKIYLPYILAVSMPPNLICDMAPDDPPAPKLRVAKR